MNIKRISKLLSMIFIFSTLTVSIANAEITNWAGYFDSNKTNVSLSNVNAVGVYDNNSTSYYETYGDEQFTFTFKNPLRISEFKISFSNQTIRFYDINNALIYELTNNSSTLATGTPNLSGVKKIIATSAKGGFYGRLYEIELVAVESSVIPPSVLSIDPSDGTKDFDINGYATITMSKNVATNSLDNVYITGVETDKSVVNNTIVLRPRAKLKYGTQYTINVEGVKDNYGDSMMGTKTSVFTTMNDNTPVEVTSIIPPPNSTNVPINTDIKIKFNKSNIDLNSIDKVELVGIANVTKNLVDDTLTLTLGEALEPMKQYTLHIEGVKDSNGNSMSAPVNVTFTTGADNTPFELVSIKPPMNSIVNLQERIEMTFNKNVNSETLKYTLKDKAGNEIPANVYSVGKTLYVVPTLKQNTEYTFTLNEVQDTYGNQLGKTYSISFKTIISTGQSAFDEILNKLVSLLGFMKEYGLKIIVAAISLGLIFIGARWLWWRVLHTWFILITDKEAREWNREWKRNNKG